MHFSYMKKISLLIALGITALFNAQVKLSGNFSFSPKEFKADTLDISQVNVYYSIDFVGDKEVPTKKKQAIGLLQIGKNYSNFFDSNKIKIDSLENQFSKLERVGAKEANLLIANKVNWHFQVLKNKALQKNIILDKAFEQYQYEENQPKIEWNISNKNKEILGYKCREATAQYRGRTYTAFFAEDLPFSDGPHQFYGLPGLILEISDRDGHFQFKAIGIDKNPLPIYLREIEKKHKTTREKFRVAQKSYHQNPGFHIKGQVYNADGTPMEMKLKELPYNPIELE